MSRDYSKMLDRFLTPFFDSMRKLMKDTSTLPKEVEWSVDREKNPPTMVDRGQVDAGSQERAFRQAILKSLSVEPTHILLGDMSDEAAADILAYAKQRGIKVSR